MRRCMVALSLLALVPAAVGAAPSPANSTIPSHVLLVGRSGAEADTATGAFTIVVRDGANVPMPGQLVEFRALLCPGARVAVNQLQAGVSSRCETNSVRATTDLDGSVRLAVLGGGETLAPHGTGPCARVYVGTALLGTARLGYLDLDGAGGLGANDLAVWLTDFSTGDPIARSDFNGDDLVGADDLALWLTAWVAGRSLQSPESYCSGFSLAP